MSQRRKQMISIRKELWQRGGNPLGLAVSLGRIPKDDRAPRNYTVHALQH